MPLSASIIGVWLRELNAVAPSWQERQASETGPTVRPAVLLSAAFSWKVALLAFEYIVKAVAAVAPVRFQSGAPTLVALWGMWQ